MNYLRSNWKINFWEPVTGKKEIANITRVLKENYPNEGKYTKIFEKKIQKLLKVKHAICVTSGTIGIFLALKSLGISEKDEVIIPDLTFGATAMAVKLTGAKLVLVDINFKNLSYNIKDLKKKITNKTKAIIPVHISGRAADMSALMSISKNKKIHIVEDAAEAFLSKYKKKYLGTIGKLGCFSLTASKTITTGQGGIIVTNDTKLFKKIKLLKNQGISGPSNAGNVIHETIGWNFKFTNLQAAMGLAQLINIKKRIKKLKEINRLYRKQLKEVKEIKILNFDLKNGEVPLWTDAYCLNRNNLIRFLEKKGIECRKYWYPMHQQKPFKISGKKFKETTKLSRNLFWLPSSLHLSKKQILYVCNLIKFYFKNK